ncbi:hypothetical protein EDC16_10344 [Testudinibacter aquarius]|uniref:Uncharacterized protein n=1 Tax=Testudinibacter aquarius TaxID=1524974 RepID=A0A4R3YAI2_9PAST|nr:hypothetical protein EDC16_10344 [Testudinibacter aquarius]
MGAVGGISRGKVRFGLIYTFRLKFNYRVSPMVTYFFDSQNHK